MGYPLGTRSTEPIKRLYAFLAICFLMCAAFSQFDTTRPTQNGSPESMIGASFFPTSSPFSHNQDGSRLNRKKMLRKLESMNREYYKTFQKRAENMFVLLKKKENLTGNNILVYWQLGEQIRTEKKLHPDNPQYDAFFMDQLSRELGLDPSTLTRIESFYALYPLVADLSLELTWPHYLRLIPIADPAQRLYYQRLATEKHWSPQDLENKISQRAYERKSPQ
jgi:hypothetical protein